MSPAAVWFWADFGALLATLAIAGLVLIAVLFALFAFACERAAQDNARRRAAAPGQRFDRDYDL